MHLAGFLATWTHFAVCITRPRIPSWHLWPLTLSCHQTIFNLKSQTRDLNQLVPDRPLDRNGETPTSAHAALKAIVDNLIEETRDNPFRQVSFGTLPGALASPFPEDNLAFLITLVKVDQNLRDIRGPSCLGKDCFSIFLQLAFHCQVFLASHFHIDWLSRLGLGNQVGSTTDHF